MFVHVLLETWSPVPRGPALDCLPLAPLLTQAAFQGQVPARHPCLSPLLVTTPAQLMLSWLPPFS